MAEWCTDASGGPAVRHYVVLRIASHTTQTSPCALTRCNAWRTAVQKRLIAITILAKSPLHNLAQRLLGCMYK